MTRIYERQTDALFARALKNDPDFARTFLAVVGEGTTNSIIALSTQTQHRSSEHGGSIDLEITRADGSILLIENKIDAGYSVTRAGDAQPERYRASVATLIASGVRAASVLLAPEIYLRGSRHTKAFDHQVSYESLRPALTGAELALIDAAIAQAETPYDPEPNRSSATFFAEYEEFARQHFPEVVVKHNPNGNGVRPTGSRTIYFVSKAMLRDYAGIPRPRVSVQTRDMNAPSASAKLMLGGWGTLAARAPAPDSLQALGAYLRPAGRSLGLVIDTPRLDTQAPFAPQIDAVREGLRAIDDLREWWNSFGGEMANWHALASGTK